MRIQHNIMAMSAYRNYTNNVSAMKKNLERLSSGYKINRAGDDAAGLAISEKMRAQITGLETAQKNAKDGISLVQTAEGALQEVHDMLNRMVELATQSANGTYEGATDRNQLQKEIKQLIDEIDRIADSANFNGIKLLNGSLDSAALQNAQDALANLQTVMGDAMSAKDIIDKLMLPQLNGGPASGEYVGVNTVLETGSGAETVMPSFQVRFDGVSHIVTEEGKGELSLELGDITITLSEEDLDLDAGTVLSGAELAQAFLDSGKISGTAVSAEEITVGGFKYSAEVVGDSLVFKWADEEKLADGQEIHFDVKLNGVTDGADIEVKNTYVTGAYDASGGVTGAIKGSLVIKATGTDGKTYTFTVSNLNGNATLATILNDLESAQSAENNDSGAKVNLTDLFTITSADNKLTFEAKTAGTGGEAITEFTFTPALNNGEAQRKFDSDGVTRTAEGGTVKTGTSGYLNAATQVNIVYKAAGEDQLASTSLDLAELFEMGGELTLGKGDSAVTYSVTKNSDGSGTVTRSTDGKEFEFSSNGDDFLRALTEAAEGHTVFSVGYSEADGDTPGKLTLKQLQSFKDETPGTMTTMEDFAGFISVKLVDKAATEAAKEAAEKAVADATEKDGKPLTLQIGDTADDWNQLKVDIQDCHAAAIGVGGISVETQEDAANAIDKIKAAINQVSDIRGTLGATQNRLDHTINNLSVMTENIQDAESTIRDTDIAEEMMAYTKNNILIQSAQAMLAQANQIPQGVLQLLQ